MEKEEEAYNLVIDSLYEIPSLRGRVAVLGNAFIQIGVDSLESAPDGPVSVARALELAQQDIERNGETIANALIRQGFILLSWIDKDKEK